MTATILMTAIGILFALIIIAHSVLTAPVGYQDDGGFHVGVQNQDGEDMFLENPS